MALLPTSLSAALKSSIALVYSRRSPYTLPRSTKAATLAVIEVLRARMALQPSIRCVEVRFSFSEHQDSLAPADCCRAAAGVTVRMDSTMAETPIRANGVPRGVNWLG